MAACHRQRLDDVETEFLRYRREVVGGSSVDEFAADGRAIVAHHQEGVAARAQWAAVAEQNLACRRSIWTAAPPGSSDGSRPGFGWSGRGSGRLKGGCREVAGASGLCVHASSPPARGSRPRDCRSSGGSEQRDRFGTTGRGIRTEPVSVDVWQRGGV